MRDNVLSWDEYFMELAKLSARRSKDPRTQVGACIIDPTTNRIVSIGYNGLPRGIKDDNKVWDDSLKDWFVVHAEANAILNTQEDLNGKILYVTMFPCNECAKLIVQKGIKEIVYLDDTYKFKQKGVMAGNIFSLTGVKLRKFGGNE